MEEYPMMKTVLRAMQKENTGAFNDVLPLFEDIVQNHVGSSSPQIGLDERCDHFAKAMKEHLTKEQRYRIAEKHGTCNDTQYDKDRRAFAKEHVNTPIAERLEMFEDKFQRCTAVFNSADNTITVKFACSHGYYKKAYEGKFPPLPESIEVYFERCAGGRLYEYQKALGVKLKIKSVDVSPIYENPTNPVVFTFEIV